MDAAMDARPGEDAGPTCGNGRKEAGEACDGADVGDASCQGLGFHLGELACTAGCAFDTTGCTTCGDGQCQGEETWANCPADCPGVSGMTTAWGHSCARLISGEVRCWGFNEHGQLGTGYTSEKEPAPVLALVQDVAELTGYCNCHTCARLEMGGVSCWGWNDFGELGPAAPMGGSIVTPLGVPGLDEAVSVSAGACFTCAVLSDGTARCFGDNSMGQLGGGTMGGFTADLVSVSGLSDGLSIAAGTSHVCALRQGGTVSCWGANDHGKLGDGSTIDRLSPVPVAFTGVAVQVTAGGMHACLLDDQGDVFCWGANARGQLGDGPSDDMTTPQRVVTLGEVASIEAGDEHTCAVTMAGTAFCWGANDQGQLGDGTSTDRADPVRIGGLEPVHGVTAAQTHSCAWLADGSAWCWGRNFGKLGDGSLGERSLVPVRVRGL
ncbi:MAG: chromosome condensation regulator RCC1 [Polyangia bacterium]|nr:chromosome condensation regulator RCC1 [Polyangia bacterium]